MLFGMDFDAARTEREETIWVVAEVGDVLAGVEGTELSSHGRCDMMSVFKIFEMEFYKLALEYLSHKVDSYNQKGMKMINRFW